MKTFDTILNTNSGTKIISCAATLLFLISFSAMTAVAAPSSDPGQEAMRRGEQMYRTGILPSGEPMQSSVAGNTPTPGTSFACVSCHLRSGLGSIEGGVNTTPANLKTLYQARDKSGTGNNRRNASMGMGSKSRNAQTIIQPPPARPAYSDATLADVLRNGRDPSGRMLDPAMPRYKLTEKDAASLIAYLKTLSAEYSPGVDKSSINFATVVTAEVPAELVDAMMLPIESFVSSANQQQVQLEAQQAKLLDFPKEVTYRRVKHSRWKLHGNPDTWQGQLEAYYRKEPVFALIGGVTTKDWQPVHKFCEEQSLPCLLPSTDLPVVSESDQYTLYFSKGLYQEGEAAAHYLQSNNGSAKPLKIVQIVSPTPQGKALADGFLNGLRNETTSTATTIVHAEKDPITREFLQQIITKEKPDVLALWTDRGILSTLAAMPDITRADLRFIISSSYPGTDIMTIPEQLRPMTYITWPYRLPQDEKKFARFIDQKLSADAQKVQSRAYAMLLVLTQALREMKGDFYRDYMLDVISMQPDIEPTLYERLTFGADRRYIAKSCYIVQLTAGDTPEFIKKSEWVIL